MDGQSHSQNTATATIELPVIIPTELGELAISLRALQNDLRREIDFYREHREPMSYSERELADYFEISLISMERIRRAGRISYTRVAGKIRYSRAQIEDYLAAAQTARKGAKEKKR